MENKTYRYYVEVGFIFCFLLVGTYINYELGINLSRIGKLSVIVVGLAALFGATFKVVVNEQGVVISSLLLSIMNDKVGWSEIKKVKYGVLFKEIEYFSKKKDKVVSLQISGLRSSFKNTLDKEIMKRIGQKTIER